MQEILKKKSDQLQMLGNIFSLLDQFDLEDMAASTDGSQLGKVVSLLCEVKATFAVLPETAERQYVRDNDQDKPKVYELVGKSSPTQAPEVMPSQKKPLPSPKKPLSGPAIVANTVSKPSAAASKSTVSKSAASKATPGKSPASKAPASKAPASKAAVNSRNSSVTSNKNQGKIENSQIPVSTRDAIVFDYLSYVFSDLEMFPSRGSINEFFKAYFTVDFNLNKKSRDQIVGRLCRLLFQKKLNRTAIGDILLRATNSKYGAFLKEKDAVFIKGWKK
jgi:hypothetical protein